jgi:hypothetical protein
MMLKANAHQKLSTLKSGTIADTSKIRSAFITKVNNPSVRIFTGRVSIRSTGLKKVLTIPINMAVTTVGKIPGTDTPGKI